MTRDEAKNFVRYVVDDAGNGRPLWDDQCAVIRDGGDATLPSSKRKGFKYPSRLVGWGTAWGTHVAVAVHSYLDVEVGDKEATELARDYLIEMGWTIASEPDFLF